MNSVFGQLQRIHFIGIGGIGMSGIAEVLHNMGFIVSGSDLSAGSNTGRLSALGIKVCIGHNADNINGAELIVYTSAINESNVEFVKARQLRIPAIKRGEMLAELMRLKYAVAVAGSHGKTTTTSMIASITKDAGLDPTILIGGRLNSIDNNAAYGSSNLMVAEADESDRSFLMLYPSIAVITNIDHEHMENYKDFSDLADSFADFANKVPFYGVAVICIDNDNVADIIPKLTKRFIRYGLKAQADIRALNIEKNGFGVSYDVERSGEIIGRIALKLPGDHIVLNSLAAVASSLEMGVSFNRIKESLEHFNGVQRRMSIRFESDKFKVIDDYGHHPTEIATTLKAIREATDNSKVIVIFEPHRYTRTKALMSEFAKCFMDADRLYIMDIYPASEKPIEGIDSHRLIAEIKNYGFKDIFYLENIKSFLDEIDSITEDHIVIVTFGAGSITKLSFEIAEYLKK